MMIHEVAEDTMSVMLESVMHGLGTLRSDARDTAS